MKTIANNSESAVKAAILANGLIMIMKLIAATLSGSASMLAEFKHSVGDFGNGLFLLIGIKQSQKPVNSRYQFGHGKRVFFWSFVASLGMLFIGGALSIYGGIDKIMHPEPLSHLPLNLTIIALSFLFEIFSVSKAILSIFAEAGITEKGWKKLPKVFPLLAQASPATHFIFLEDCAALIGLLIAAAAILLSHYTGNLFYDGFASILIGLMLFLIGLSTARENASAILGEAADPQLIQSIGNFVLTLEQVKDVHLIRSMSIGPNCYLLEMVIEANEKLILQESDLIIKQVKTQVMSKYNSITYCHISIISEDGIKDWICNN